MWRPRRPRRVAAARVPLLVHEQNRVAGFTNRMLAALREARAGRFRRCVAAGRVGRQSGARRDRGVAAAGAAHGRPRRPAAPAGARRQPGRARAESGAAAGAGAADARRSVPRCCHQCGSARSRRSARGVCAGRRRGAGGGRSSTTWPAAYALGRSGGLPRRRADPGRAGRGGTAARCWCRSRMRWTTTRRATPKCWWRPVPPTGAGE